jgi:hypothetical protein
LKAAGTLPRALIEAAGAVFFTEMDCKRNVWPWVLLLGALLLVLAGALVLDRVASWPAQELDSLIHQTSTKAKKVRDALFDVFQLQPKISIDNSLLFDQTKTALELAVVSRDTEVIRNTRQTWIGSTKRIRIHAKYRVKAGFDLSRKLNVEVTDYGVAVKVPKAKILSVEPVFLSIEELRDGLWNKIQAQDLDSALWATLELARWKEATLPEEAEQTFKKLLSEKLDNLHLHVETQFEDEPMKKSSWPPQF